MVMKWDKFKGTIKGNGCEATVDMMFAGPIAEPSPFWMALFSSPGEQETKPFKEGELEQAHRWCVDRIHNYEQQLKQRGDIAS